MNSRTHACFESAAFLFSLTYSPWGFGLSSSKVTWADSFQLFSCSFSFPLSLLPGQYGVTMKGAGAVFLLGTFGLLFVSHTLLFFQMTVNYHVNIIIGRKKDQVVSSEVEWINPGSFISIKWALSFSKVHNGLMPFLTSPPISSFLHCRCYTPIVRPNSTELTVCSISVLKTIWIDTWSHIDLRVKFVFNSNFLDENSLYYKKLVH